MSNVVLTPIITNLGRDALMKGFSSPENYRFSQVALGDGDGYIPEPGSTTLINEKQRIDVKSVVVQDATRLHITAVAGLPGRTEAKNPFAIHEIGFYLQPIGKDGKDEGSQILFAIYATEVGKPPLLTKDPATELLLAFDLLLPDGVDGNLNFDKDSYLHLNLPPATQERSGLLRLATDVETKAGKSIDNAVSPAGLSVTLKAQTVSPDKLKTTIAKFREEIASKKWQWQVPELINNWAPFDKKNPPSYCKDSMGVVHFRGRAVNETNTEFPIFELPDGFKPPHTLCQVICTSEKIKFGQLNIPDNGYVERIRYIDPITGDFADPYNEGVWVSLDGVMFSTV